MERSSSLFEKVVKVKTQEPEPRNAHIAEKKDDHVSVCLHTDVMTNTSVATIISL